MDRNIAGTMAVMTLGVASREGGRGSQHGRGTCSWPAQCRLPRGGRGSQLWVRAMARRGSAVASREGGVDRNIRDCVAGNPTPGRLPRGGRGSQPFHHFGVATGDHRRLPRGGRGSQLRYGVRRRGHGWSPPARGAWIATPQFYNYGTDRIVASREGGVDRNSWRTRLSTVSWMSPPARGAWIATPSSPACGGSRPGRLPRGGAWIATTWQRRSRPTSAVASREGGVDRNVIALRQMGAYVSRLPRGGRGSQQNNVRITVIPGSSPPARGAWIATACVPACACSRSSRLPRGGRGSQPVGMIRITGYGKSPPARGAWIATSRAWPTSSSGSVASREGGVDRNILGNTEGLNGVEVASREGGVDRNNPPPQRQEDGPSRLPRGGRGSQHGSGGAGGEYRGSPPARGAWIATTRLAK